MLYIIRCSVNADDFDTLNCTIGLNSKRLYYSKAFKTSFSLNNQNYNIFEINFIC